MGVFRKPNFSPSPFQACPELAEGGEGDIESVLSLPKEGEG